MKSCVSAYFKVEWSSTLIFVFIRYRILLRWIVFRFQHDTLWQRHLGPLFTGIALFLFLFLFSCGLCLALVDSRLIIHMCIMYEERRKKMQRFPFKAGSSNFSHILDIFISQATHSF